MHAPLFGTPNAPLSPVEFPGRVVGWFSRPSSPLGSDRIGSEGMGKEARVRFDRSGTTGDRSVDTHPASDPHPRHTNTNRWTVDRKRRCQGVRLGPYETEEVSENDAAQHATGSETKPERCMNGGNVLNDSDGLGRAE